MLQEVNKRTETGHFLVNKSGQAKTLKAV